MSRVGVEPFNFSDNSSVTVLWIRLVLMCPDCSTEVFTPWNPFVNRGFNSRLNVSVEFFCVNTGSVPTRSYCSFGIHAVSSMLGLIRMCVSVAL